MVSTGTLSDALEAGAWRGTVTFAEVPYHFEFLTVFMSPTHGRFELVFIAKHPHCHPKNHARVYIPCSRLQDETSLRNMFTRSKVVDILFG